MEKRVIPVLEMSCAVCAATVEKTVRELTGVEEASVNFSANTLQVVYDPDKISLKDMQAAVSAAGYDLVISEMRRLMLLMPNIVFISICEEEPLVLGVSDCR